MSVNLYQTGVTGLLAAQQQLATTGNNIANVNTEGYSRQRAEQSTLHSIQTGGNFVGTGTYVADIARLYDQFAYKEQIQTQTGLGAANASHSSLNRLNDLMTTGGESINTNITQFYQSMSSLADNPSDSGLRNIAFKQAETLAGSFNQLSSSFDRLEQSTNDEIETITEQISEIAVQIARVNEQIQEAQGLGDHGEPNDLLDERDRLISQLSEYTSVNTINDANDVMTVMIAGGNTLVAGITPLQLSVQQGDPNPLQSQVTIVGNNAEIPLKAESIGGALSAKLSFRDQDLAQAKREIDRLALAISDTLNTAQSEGLDINQQQGTNFYTDINSAQVQAARVRNFNDNTGNLNLGVAITDVKLVPANNFEVAFDGTDYQLTNLADGSVTNLGAPGSGTYNTAFGFSFTENSGAPAAGDKFRLEPNKDSAANIKLALNNSEAIAASSAVQVTPSDNNISSGKVEIVDVLDPEAARLAMPVRVDVLENPPGSFTYTLTDNGGTTTAPVTYTPPAQQIAVPPAPATTLFNIEISGNPSGQALNAPEQFTISDAFGLGNGKNAKAMADQQDQSILNGSSQTFSQSLAVTTSQVGSSAKSAELESNTAQAMFNQAFSRNQETSGVNLDEEAANLLRFQQAYQASSRVVSVANTIFDTLLSAVS